MWSECLAEQPRWTLIVENAAGRLSSDAGLLVSRELDERIGLTKQVAATRDDRREGAGHSLLAMVRQRVDGILAGHEDQHDHDTFRYESVLHRVAEEGEELVSQPTLSRLVNAIRIPAL